MAQLYQNGFLVQHLYNSPHGMEDTIHTCGYNGLSARISNPLSVFPDKESLRLSEKAEWRMISDQEYVLQEFISDPYLLLQYVEACKKLDIPIRLLFVESDFSEEIWMGPDLPKELIGYEYNTIPIDNQIISDLSWYRPLFPFLNLTNLWGLFPSWDDVMLFKAAYDQALNTGEIGDGYMETHIFRLYEVQPDDVLGFICRNANYAES